MVRQPTEDLIGQNGGNDNILAASVHGVSTGENGAEVIAGMPSLLTGKAIIEVKIANHDAIGEGCQIETGLLTAAQDSGRHVTLVYPPCNPAGYFPRFAGIGTDCTAEGIDKKTLYLVYHLGWDVLILD